MMTVSRLLKSCATPPVSWPMRLHLLRLGKLLLRPLQRLLRLPPLGDVARDLGEADQLAVVVADRVDDDAGPEARAVLAHAPALGLELALARAPSRSARAGTPAARSASV